MGDGLNGVKNQAERLRIGIRGGWLRIDEAIAWADAEIAREAEPHPSVLDVALAHRRTREEIASLLSTVPGSADMVAVMRWCLHDLLVALEREPGLARDAARWLHANAWDWLPESEFGSEPYVLADMFAVADEGYGTREEVHARLLAFLREHARQG